MSVVVAASHSRIQVYWRSSPTTLNLISEHTYGARGSLDEALVSGAIGAVCDELEQEGVKPETVLKVVHSALLRMGYRVCEKKEKCEK